MHRIPRSWLAWLPAALVLCTASLASASPWTLPRGTGVVAAGYSYQLATQEWFSRDDAMFRDARNFPLAGRYEASTFTVQARVGLTDRLELDVSLPLKLVSYGSDSVILLPNDPVAMTPGAELDYYQQNIIQLARTRSGIGDIQFATRYRWLLQPLALATELRIKAPTGYDAPVGTFGARPNSIQDFIDNAGTYARPSNVQDDVTLGDGQLDVGLNVLLGYAFPTRTFVRLDAGYNLRFGKAADQLVGRLSLGQLIGRSLLFYVGGQLTWSAERGDVIGISVAAIDPNLPAQDYAGLANLYLREVRLERDAIDVNAGMIVKITDTVEMNVGYGRTLWGRNTALTNAFSLGFAVRSDWFGSDLAASVESAAAADARAAAEDARAAADEARQAVDALRQALEAQPEAYPPAPEAAPAPAAQAAPAAPAPEAAPATETAPARRRR